MLQWLSNRGLHFFHVVSTIRPIVWIGLYVAVTPLFALVYWLLPEGQFRIPDENPMDYGSCLYYSIVTITTLGFGDYTPTHAWSQGVTAFEVMTGLIVLGLFLNAVGSMKSEIDVSSAIERQRMMHYQEELDKLVKMTPLIIHTINLYLSNCYYMTTPSDRIDTSTPVFNPEFTLTDLADRDAPSPTSGKPLYDELMASGRRTSLFLDSIQNRIDITLWPKLIEEFFTFVATEQMFEHPGVPSGRDDEALADFIRRTATAAISIESELSELALAK